MEKTFVFKTATSPPARATVVEDRTSPGSHGYVWDAAVALAAFLSHDVGSRGLSGRRVLELGAGCGLPGLVAAAIGARSVVLTDRADAAVRLLSAGADLHARTVGAESAVGAAAFAFGGAIARLGEGGAADLVLCSDVLGLDESAFEPLIKTLLDLARERERTLRAAPAQQQQAPLRVLMSYRRRARFEDAFFSSLTSRGLRARCVREFECEHADAVGAPGALREVDAAARVLRCGEEADGAPIRIFEVLVGGSENGGVIPAGGDVPAGGIVDMDCGRSALFCALFSDAERASLAADFARDAAALLARFGDGPRHLACDVEASGLQSRAVFPLRELRDVYLPLLYLPRTARRRQGTRRRTLVGLVGPAGSGKSTAASILVRLGAAIGLRCAAVSMDGYHLPNVELVERDLRSRKGVIESIHGTALAADLELLLEPAPAPVAQPPPPPAGPPLGARRSWAEVDADGTVHFAEYDRAVTHDPVLRAVAVPRDAELVFVEGLFVARGDGRRAGARADEPPPGEAVVGPDAAAWARVHRVLDETVLLAVPMQLCRARCLMRRVGNSAEAAEALAAGGGPLDLDALPAALRDKLEKTADHYRRNDAPTWTAIVEGDAHRAGIHVVVPLPPELEAAQAAAGGGDIAPIEAVKALAAAEAREGGRSGAYAGAIVRRTAVGADTLH